MEQPIDPGESSSEDYESPAEWLYSGWNEILQKLSTSLLERVVLVLSLWQLSHEKDLMVSSPPLEDWIQILKDIGQTPKANPLKELSHSAQRDSRAIFIFNF